MSQGWPTEPGQQPPVPSAGAPPVRGQGAPTPPPLVPPAPASPSSSSWPSGPSDPTLGGAPPGGAATGPGGPPPEGGRRRTLLVVALVALVALVSSLGTYLVFGGNDDGAEPEAAASSTTEPAGDEDEADDPDTDPSTPPSSASSSPTVTEEELTAEVRDLQAFVEDQRGLEFREDVTVELLDDTEFEARLLETLEDDLGDIELQDQLLTALGLIDGDVDLLAASEQLLGAGVLGYYETEENELVVRGTALTPYTRQTIVHELVHALDDQWYELYRPEYDERDDEIGRGFSAVLEGNARRVEDAWLTTLSDDELDERDREEALYALNADLTGIPDALIALLSAPYEDGRLLVDELAAVGGEPAIDDAITEPPTTTEQVVFPDRFLVGEGAAEVAPPEADGEVIDEGLFGVLMLRVMLEQTVLPSEARRAIDGWAGDWYVAWEPDDETTCVRVDVVMDTSDDAAELLDSLEEYVLEHPTVAVAEQDDTTLRIDACTPPPSGGGGGSRT